MKLIYRSLFHRKLFICLIAMAIALLVGALISDQLSAQLPSNGPAPQLSIGEPVFPSEFTGDLRNLPQTITAEERKLFHPPMELDFEPPEHKQRLPWAEPEMPAPFPGPMAPMPTPIVTFNAMTFALNGAGHPPDTVGDVGPNHFVQAVNTSVGIYNKTGTALSTVTFTSLWSGASTGTPCDTTHNGDPTVIYDPQGDRFIIADFAWTDIVNGPYYECIAVSKTNNPVSGGWWRYGVRADDAAHPWLPDYPKMGIWPDGLYMSVNMFDCLTAGCGSATYEQVRVYAFNLSDLESGAVLRSVVFDTNSTSRFTLLPSNYRGTVPPSGRPNFFVGESQTLFAWEVFQFHVDWVTPGNSTFTGPTNVSQASYATAASTVPEPAPGNASDTLAERAMMQNQYRNISGVESVWVNHTTGTATVSTPTGLQWAQINVTGGTVNTTPVQQQIFNNGADGLNRFIGALAVDKQGNMAIGYTASSSSVAPDIRYAGRLTTDTLSTLGQTETTMLPGVTRSVQTGTCGSTCTRWGDYSAMSVDPTDDCTFWYTHMYFPVQGTNWVTRIGSFKFPTCGATPTPSPTPSPSPSPSPSPTPSPSPSPTPTPTHTPSPTPSPSPTPTPTPSPSPSPSPTPTPTPSPSPSPSPTPTPTPSPSPSPSPTPTPTPSPSPSPSPTPTPTPSPSPSPSPTPTPSPSPSPSPTPTPTPSPSPSPSPTPTPTPSPSPSPTPTPTPTPSPSPSPSPTPTPTQSPSPSPSPTPTPSPSPSPSPTPTPTPSPSPSPTPTPTPTPSPSPSPSPTPTPTQSPSPSPTPTPTPSPSPSPSPTPSPSPSPSPTPTPTPTPSPSPSPSPTPTHTPSPSPSPSPTPTPTPSPSPSPSPTPSPTPSPSPSPSPTPTLTPSPSPSPSTSPTPTAPPTVCNLTEEFDDITTLPPAWYTQNNSQPLGTTGWFQGNSTIFTSQSGGATSYIATNYNNGAGLATLSNWLLTPPVTLENGAQLIFWTRTTTGQFPDRLQVRMSTNSTSTNVGVTETDTGDFNSLLLDVNPTYTTTGYPVEWTQFIVTINAVAAPTKGRLAFRYFVENGGPSGANSDYIGIDTVQYACNGFATPSPTPTPTSTPSATPAPTPTPSPMPTQKPTPTPTPTPAPVSLSGAISYCSNPSPGPVAGVTLSLTGTSTGSTLTDGSGDYQFLGLISGGTYTVTPFKAPLTPGNGAINTIDIVAVQRHFLMISSLPPGCRLTAGDVNGDSAINTIDAIAMQRFFLSMSTGLANVGKYSFLPASRTYPGVTGDQTGQNYDTLVFGDVASPYVGHSSGPLPNASSSSINTVAEVALPTVVLPQSKQAFVAAINSTVIDEKNNIVGFQGDFTFDERVVQFESNPVQKAGLTGGNWSVSGNVLPGKGPTRILRVSAFSTDFSPLSGSGTLFELRMTRATKKARSTPLIWAAAPDDFIFIDTDLNIQSPVTSKSGSVTSSAKRK